MASEVSSSKTIQFLNESNKIEGIHEIDYRFAAFQCPDKGHFGAYILSQNEARGHKPLTARMIRQWQGLLGLEQKLFTGSHISDEEIGHFRSNFLRKNVRIGAHAPPDYSEVGSFIMRWIDEINEDLRKNADLYAYDNTAFLKCVSSWFLQFERIHPFADGNGRTGRLIANYIATYCNRPTFVFPADRTLRNKYIDAHKSVEAMQEYLTARLAEEKNSECTSSFSKGTVAL